MKIGLGTLGTPWMFFARLIWERQTWGLIGSLDLHLSVHKLTNHWLADHLGVVQVVAYAHGPIRFKSNLLTLLCSINSSHPAPTPRPALQLECVCNQVDQLDTPPGDEAGDQVNAEAQAWAALPEAEVALHRNGLGLVVEFALMSRLKKKFPLHYIVFRQSPSHLSHEGSVERVFFGQRSGLTPRCARVCRGWPQRQVSTKSAWNQLWQPFGQGTRRSTCTKGCRRTKTATTRPIVTAQIPRTLIPTIGGSMRERYTCAWIKNKSGFYLMPDLILRAIQLSEFVFF